MRFELVRPDDLLNLTVETSNLRVVHDDDVPCLTVDDEAQPAWLRVTLPPQTVAESAYFEYSGIPPDPPPALPPGSVADPDAAKTPADTDDPPPPGTKRADASGVARLAAPSRLVFDVPPGTPLPLTVEGLLNWSGLRLRVNPIAAVPPGPTAAQIAQAPGIEEPDATQTAIELPSRLWISPNPDVAWVHRFRPFTSRGRTELWHTQLQLRDGEDVREPTQLDGVPLRAIWSPDYRPSDPPQATELDELGLTAMAPDDRHQIVILTSAFHGYEVEGPSPVGPVGPLGLQLFFPLRSRPYVPEPFYAERLMLSPLGGWLRSLGRWTPPRLVLEEPRRLHGLRDLFAEQRVVRDIEVHRAERGARVDVHLVDDALDRFVTQRKPYFLDLSEWAHIATQGRDHYVRIVYEGYLLPFLNRAALVKVTERKFVERNGIVGAYLLQRMFIVVREPERTFAHDRGMPFKHIRITTLVTPNIAKPNILAGSHRSFWVEVEAPGRVRFPFHVVGTDAGGNSVDFTIPMLFRSFAETDVTLVHDAYNHTATTAELTARDAVVPGQRVVFARTDADGPPPDPNADLVAERLNFVVDRSSGAAALLKADVRIPQVQELLGTSAATTIRLFRDYVEHGLGPANNVFAEVARFDAGKAAAAGGNPLAGIGVDSLGVDFSADKAGGFTTPDMGVKTLSSQLGPLAATTTEAVAGTFDPASFFGATSALLFGTFRLLELVAGDSLAQNAPKLRTHEEAGKVVTELLWQPGVKPVGVGIASFKPGPATSLDVTGTITKPLGGGADAATFRLDGRLADFVVSLLESVDIRFVAFTFSARSGAKPDVGVELDPANPVTFTGDLEFVEELRRAIPPGIFGDGPSLDVSPTGIRAGFGIGLPEIEVGVFSLSGVNLGTALTLPFLDGKPSFEFAFSSREHPFQLAVTLFGGGGFFRLELDTAGIKQLEAALEFGVVASLDLGVASGTVHYLAGIYFSLQRHDPGGELRPTLTGYFRAGGQVSVLCLITITLEIVISFTYLPETKKAYGRASVTVKVEVVCFSKSVTLTMERGFGGESGDPKFKDQFPSAELWSGYAKAFA